MEHILIQNGTLYTMEEGTEPFQGDLLVAEGKIKSIAKEICPATLPSDTKVVDASGMNIFPGLIDAHSHIGLFDFNGENSVDDANEMTGPVTLSVDARYGVNPKAKEFRVAYEYGITTMLLTPGSGNVFCGLPFALKTYGDNVFDMSIKAPCAVKIALGGESERDLRGSKPASDDEDGRGKGALGNLWKGKSLSGSKRKRRSLGV